MTAKALSVSLPRAAPRLGIGLAVLGLLALAGTAVVVKPAALVLVPLVVLWAVILANWRVGLVALFVFLPFAGLPIFMSGSRYAPIAKDLALVLPLYASFALDARRNGRRILPDRDALLPLLGVFAGLAVAYVAYSSSLLVAAIGLKVWVFYLPLYLVGFHYVRGLEDFARLLRLTALLALIPAGIAFAELLSFNGHDYGPLMRLYGPFQHKIVQEAGFTGFNTVIVRIPSTFSSAAGYYNFSIFAFAAALGYWRYRRSSLAGLLALVLALGCIASGIRRSYFMVPLLALAAVLVMRGGHSTKLRVIFGGIAVVVILSLFDVHLVQLLRPLRAGANQAVTGTSHQFLPALGHSVLGHGTGSDTNAALRYGGGAPLEGVWREAWYTKSLVEFGLPGLGLALVLIGTAVLQGYRRLTALTGVARQVAAPLWGVLLVTAITLAKAAELDWDPMDAYFWLAAGLLGGLAYVVRGERARPEAA